MENVGKDTGLSYVIVLDEIAALFRNSPISYDIEASVFLP